MNKLQSKLKGQNTQLELLNLQLRIQDKLLETMHELNEIARSLNVTDYLCLQISEDILQLIDKYMPTLKTRSGLYDNQLTEIDKQIKDIKNKINMAKEGTGD